MFPRNWIHFAHFWWERHRNDVAAFSVLLYQKADYVCLGPVMLNFIIWLRWDLPGVSTVILLFCYTDLGSLWGDIRLHNNLFLFNLSLTSLYSFDASCL